MSNVDDSIVTSAGEGQSDSETTTRDVITDNTVTTDLPASKNVHEISNNGTNTSEEDTDVTVKLVFMPEGAVKTTSYSINKPMSNLKTAVSYQCGQPASSILFLYDGNLLNDDSTLLNLGGNAKQIFHIEVQSIDPINAPLKLLNNSATISSKQNSPYKMPDVLNIRVESEYEGLVNEIKIHVIQEKNKKPFLGGFRHRLTGVEYHNASMQTVSKKRLPPSEERFNRDTQTVDLKNQFQQTTNTTSTQMTKEGCYVSNFEDKIITPSVYVTADEHHKKILEKVIILQCYWRKWLAMNYVENLRQDRENRYAWERKEDEIRKREKAEKLKREWERRMNPSSKTDFDLLYAALEKWKREEIAKINELMNGPERKAALACLLEQEAYLIASIGRHKSKADVENKEKRDKQFLNKAASPKRWKAFDGKITEMDTPYTLRAQELRDIFNSLSMKYLTQDERLDVLLTVKHTVKEHDCKLTQEIIELIDREADLLMRGVKESNLEGLRQRIATLFLQYCKTPLFNPEASRLLKVPQDPSTLRKNIYFCPSCRQYLSSTEFQIGTNSRVVGKCRRCQDLDNDARLRQDFSQYKMMLQSLRRSEELFKDGSKIAFLLQESDLRYLIESIWNTQSALSAQNDLYDLVFIRWNKHEEWSPWNCILLTKEEASAHEKLENVTEAYGRMFIGKVLHKHVLARNYFSKLPEMARHLQSSISHDLIGLSLAPASTTSKA
ncbi:IQ and ubiquitin-like domain-containing protein [Dendronephthya gigantea]|uniref:IQ and ubiquitin-like domain-containing protein n=1 Tax=Dendronephthya gigantea TaxID=151771 RepID=UPI00106CD3E8|nr:IQ and ubiquitin-like domain-containing protein [Dendronephthya gigantea]